MARGYNMGGMNRNQMIAQARKMQEQRHRRAAEGRLDRGVGERRRGAVKVTATGGMRLTSLTIDPEALDPEDVEMLQDMILAAVNDALESAEQMASQQMGSVTGGLNIPGLF